MWYPLFFNINIENCLFVFLLLTKLHSLPVDQECIIVRFGTKINKSHSLYYLLSKNKPFPVCFRLIPGQFTGLKCWSRDLPTKITYSRSQISRFEALPVPSNGYNQELAIEIGSIEGQFEVLTPSSWRLRAYPGRAKMGPATVAAQLLSLQFAESNATLFPLQNITDYKVCCICIIQKENNFKIIFKKFVENWNSPYWCHFKISRHCYQIDNKFCQATLRIIMLIK